MYNLKKYKYKGEFYCFDGNSGRIYRTNSIFNKYIDSVLEMSKKDFVRKNLDLGNSISVWEKIKAFSEENLIKSRKYHNVDIDFISEAAVCSSKIIFFLSDLCNLKCNYCINSEKYSRRNKKNGRISKEIVSRCLNYVFVNRDKSAELSVGFYGGEPTLQFDLIKEVVEICNESKEKARFYFTTNGVLLTNEMIDFFIKNDFAISVSVDVDKTIHDTNRRTKDDKPTYDTVIKNMDRIKQINGEYFKKNIQYCAVVDNAHDYLKALSSGFKESNVSFKHESYNDESKRFEKIKKYYSEDHSDVKLYRNNTEKSIDNLCNLSTFEDIEDVEMEFIEKLDYIHNRNVDVESSYLGQQCIPGSGKLFIDSNGDFYTCENLSHCFKIGDYLTGIDKVSAVKFYKRYTEFRYKYCNHCWAKSMCQTCAIHFVDNDKKDVFVMDNATCKSRKYSISNDLKHYSHICHQLGEQNMNKLFKRFK